MEENIQSQVLKVLQSAKAGLQMEDLADKLNLTRHTVAKYLEVLRAEGKIHYNKIGRTKIWTDISTAVEVRFLGMDDLEDILRIGKKILGEQYSDISERLISLKETGVQHLRGDLWGQPGHAQGRDHAAGTQESLRHHQTGW